jgi:hypothetical protein
MTNIKIKKKLTMYATTLEDTTLEDTDDTL